LAGGSDLVTRLPLQIRRDAAWGPPGAAHEGYGHLVATIGPSDIQAALDAAVAGDLDPLVGLLDPDLDWRGIRRGHLWWRRAPA
jgi:hypothetical protein